MSLEPAPPLTRDRAPAIENEIPTYRAISRMAIASLVLGATSILCVASPWFLLLAGLAIVAGVLGQRTIRRFPDMYTGVGFAQSGIAMAVIFGLSATTYAVISHVRLDRSAQRFLTQYAQVLSSGNLAESYWWKLPAAGRKGTTPDKALDDLVKNAADPMSREMAIGSLENLTKSVSERKSVIHFVETERSGYDRRTPYAFGLMEIESPGSTAEKAYAMIEVRGDPDAAHYDWYVQQVIFPYQRNSHQLKVAPVDDGHGHAH